MLIKRWISILLCAGMLLVLTPCLAEETEEDGEIQPAETEMIPDMEEAEPDTDEPDQDAQEDPEAGLEVILPERLQKMAYRLTDGYVQSRVSLKAGESVSISLPQGSAGILLKWYETPGSYEVLAGGGTVVVEDSVLNRWIPVSGGSCLITVLSACALSEVVPVSEEDAETVQNWEMSGGKADVLFLLAEPGDELRCFGGLLPYLSEGCGIRAAAVYVTTREKRYRSEEAMEVLWEGGIREFPVFGTFSCRNYDLLNILEEDWKDRDIIAFLREQIERFRPEVIIANGSGGTQFPTRTVASRCVMEAVKQAGWDVKKVYTQEGAFDGSRFPETVRIEELGGHSLSPHSSECNA